MNPWHVSGGPEHIHQLCSEINDMEIDCYLIYSFCHIGNYVPKSSDHNKFIPEYSHYNLKRCFFVEDEPENVLILPECYHPNILHQTKNIKLVYWWLSTDNPNFQWDLKDPIFGKILNACQSDRAMEKLLKYLPKDKVLPLHDHVKDYFILSEEEIVSTLPIREKIVLYNPAKQPHSFTQELMNIVSNIDSSIQFKALSEMNCEQVKNLASKSRLYIDFGFHPGRENMPREMVGMGCSIIVGNEGTSSNNNDIPLFERKFKNPYDLNEIAKRIVYEVNNHSLLIFDEELKNYREIVRKDKTRFQQELKSLIDILKDKTIINLSKT